MVKLKEYFNPRSSLIVNSFEFKKNGKNTSKQTYIVYKPLDYALKTMYRKSAQLIKRNVASVGALIYLINVQIIVLTARNVATEITS